MKKLILNTLTILILYSCGNQITPLNEQENQVNISEKSLIDSGYEILIIDSCEYIVFAWIPRDDHVITHKGNCKFCLERSKKINKN